MPKAVDGTRHKNRRKKLFALAKGYYGRRHSNFKSALESVRRGLVYAYRDRKAKKRELRNLWVIRLSAFLREREWNYSQFIFALKENNILLNRKSLAFLAVHDPSALESLVQKIRN